MFSIENCIKIKNILNCTHSHNFIAIFTADIVLNLYIYWLIAPKSMLYRLARLYSMRSILLFFIKHSCPPTGTSDMSKFICSAGCQRQTCQTSPTITSTTSASNCRLLADDSRLLPALTVSLIACGVDSEFHISIFTAAIGCVRVRQRIVIVQIYF